MNDYVIHGGGGGGVVMLKGLGWGVLNFRGFFFFMQRSLFSQQYFFIKMDVAEGMEEELARKLSKYGVSLRQYRQSLNEEEILPSRLR